MRVSKQAFPKIKNNYNNRENKQKKNCIDNFQLTYFFFAFSKFPNCIVARNCFLDIPDPKVPKKADVHML